MQKIRYSCLGIATVLMAMGSMSCGMRRDAREAAPSQTTGKEGLNGFIKAAGGHFSVRLEWVSGAPRVAEPAQCQLSFLNGADSPPQHVLNVKVVPWMPQYGHGSSVAPQATQVAAGPADVVEVSGISLPMSGQWELQVTATVDNQTDVAKIPIQVQ